MTAVAASALAEVADLGRVLQVTAARLSIDPAWVVGADHARRPQAAYARRIFCFAAIYWLGVSSAAVARFLDVSPRAVHRLVYGYRDAAGQHQAGGLALIQSNLDTYQLALQLREDLCL